MSDSPKIYAGRAIKAVQHLAARWNLQLCDELDVDGHMGGTHVAGSIRRGLEKVGDIDLVCPMPRAGGTDPLYEAMVATLEIPDKQKKRSDWEDQQAMFFGEKQEAQAPPPGEKPTKIGRGIRGINPHFRSASVLINCSGDQSDNPVTGRIQLPVQVFRYDPGNAGNFGWVMIVRTGCQMFSTAVLTLWKSEHGIDKLSPGSDTYLLDAAGKRIATPTERHVFSTLGLPYMMPIQRDQKLASSLFGRARKVGT